MDLDSQSQFSKMLFEKEKWSSYIHCYLHSEITLLDVKQHCIFLARFEKSDLNFIMKSEFILSQGIRNRPYKILASVSIKAVWKSKCAC